MDVTVGLIRGVLSVLPGGCSARVVTVSPGPLIRVEGQPVSIRCDVNDYGGPSEQDFDWEMSRDITGPKTRIISTFEPGFSDPLFSRRVASGDVSVVRLQDNEVELKIGEVKLTDAGFYLCRTPSTDPITSGNYNAQVQLRGKKGRNLSEGNIFPINSVQASPHHAAATTVFHSRVFHSTDFVSVIGDTRMSGFCGCVVLLCTVKTSVKLIGLVSSPVMVYLCFFTCKHNVTELIFSFLTLFSTEPNFTLTLEAATKPQKTGEPIELSCDVTNIFQLPPGGRLGVRWEHISLPGTNAPSPKLIGSLDAYGNLESNSAYKDRLDSGVLGLSRARPNTFKLRFLRSQKIDMGQYVCSVSAWSVSSQGEMVQAVEYKSSPLTVRWDTKTPTLNVAAKTIRQVSVGGATFEMSCSAVTENIGDWIGFAVYIQSQDGIKGGVKTIISLSPDNVVQITDPARSDSLVLSKTGSGEFRFRLEGVQVSDTGYYWCNVTAFTKQQPDQSWTTAATSESNKVNIFIKEDGLTFSVKIHSDASSVYPWEMAKMECSVGVSGSLPKSGRCELSDR
uniref:Ig-like domain-containing protein n=1 Tax=Xiphophorus couchianus TaxID=32473 RepID=A0A3B5N159_9TELE